MILEASGKEVELLFKAIKMEQFGDKYGKGDTQLFLQTAAYEGALKPLVGLLRYFSNAFGNDEAAYEFIDKMLDGGKTIADIYTEIFEGINSRGFFTQPLEVSQTPPIGEKAMMASLMKKVLSEENLAAMMQSKIGETPSEHNVNSLLNAG